MKNYKEELLLALRNYIYNRLPEEMKSVADVPVKQGAEKIIQDIDRAFPKASDKQND